MVFSRGEGGGPYHRLALRLAPAAVVVAGGLTVLGETKPLLLIGGIYLAAFFVVAVTCHGELAADRPPARDLTRFYAYVALGGRARRSLQRRGRAGRVQRADRAPDRARPGGVPAAVQGGLLDRPDLGARDLLPPVLIAAAPGRAVAGGRRRRWRSAGSCSRRPARPASPSCRALCASASRSGSAWSRSGR